MSVKSLIATSLCAAMITASGAAWSCDMAGPNTHIGLVSAVDRNAQTFTIIDAQTNAPITFSAPAHLIKAVQKNQRVTVNYAKEGNGLVAKTLTM